MDILNNNPKNAKINFRGSSTPIEQAINELDQKSKGHSHKNLKDLDNLNIESLITEDKINNLMGTLKEEIKNNISNFESNLNELGSKKEENLSFRFNHLRDLIYKYVASNLEEVRNFTLGKKEDLENKIDTAIQQLESSFDQQLSVINKELTKIDNFENEIKKLVNTQHLKDEISKAVNSIVNTPQEKFKINGEEISNLIINKQFLEGNKLNLSENVLVNGESCSELIFPADSISIEEGKATIKLNTLTESDISDIIKNNELIDSLKNEVERKKRVIECLDVISAGSGKIITDEERLKLSLIDINADKSDITKKEVQEIIDEAKKHIDIELSSVNAKMDLVAGNNVLSVNQLSKDLREEINISLTMLQSKITEVFGFVKTKTASAIDPKILLTINEQDNKIKILETTLQNTLKKLESQAEVIQTLMVSNKNLQQMSMGKATSSQVDLTSINGRIDNVNSRVDALTTRLENQNDRINGLLK